MSTDTTPAPTPTPTVNADKIPLYEGSTQFRHWRFSPEELTRTRTNLNAAAVTVIRDAIEADTAGRISYILDIAQRVNTFHFLLVARVIIWCIILERKRRTFTCETVHQ